MMPEMGGDGNVGRGMPRPTLRSRSCGGLRWGDAAQGGVGPHMVVIVLPVRQDGPGMIDRAEQRLVEAFVS